MSGATDETLASFKVNSELWQRFQARCVERGTTAAEVLKNLIADYLKQTNDSSSISSNLSLDDLIESLIQEKVANYLDQYLDSRIVSFLEDYLQETSQDSLKEPDSSSTEVKTSDVEESLHQEQESLLLKTAKELATILGVSAPYITTLNRIGELQQWGWQDSGKRRGKTILYQPIDK